MRKVLRAGRSATVPLGSAVTMITLTPTLVPTTTDAIVPCRRHRRWHRGRCRGGNDRRFPLKLDQARGEARALGAEACTGAHHVAPHGCLLGFKALTQQPQQPHAVLQLSGQAPIMLLGLRCASIQV